MATREMGVIREKKVRDLWDHEAHDFTPWLAENLDLLGRALQMDLEHVQTEAPVGRFFLDILARDVRRGLKVVIENQLEQTDHSHMGQLLTYAADLGASIVVWIAPHFCDEHQATIDWLNRTTSENIEFFAVEVRAITIEGKDKDKGASLLAPEFRPVAFPNEWTKGNAGKRNAARQLTKQREFDFFEPLVNKLQKPGFTTRHCAMANGTNGVERFSDDRVKNTYYSAWFGFGNSAIVSVNMVNRKLYLKLREREGQITVDLRKADIRKRLYWRSFPSGFSDMQVRLEGTITDPPEKLKEIESWMCDTLPKFEEIMDIHIRACVRELDADATDSSTK